MIMTGGPFNELKMLLTCPGTLAIRITTKVVNPTSGLLNTNNWYGYYNHANSWVNL